MRGPGGGGNDDGAAPLLVACLSRLLSTVFEEILVLGGRGG